ncbi:hypothetical protein LU631_14170 [Erwinia tracheiphila]|uniref:Uncharacterized protein n=1 Tax=Erwinia tracheiphila TaxID=65700 RepID=A0A0M2K6I0_9GAMM|nr:hypothetical protein [Erwinia tracheiphila]EOS93369.1 hemolysin-coregulated protein [Erwinia tracheiphila PSU-1]KKF34544.1 hypothetical protein SY86_02230 [Erwinia tracheiphila]UIA81683.1 hypothetical protein LU604_13120 [Erwinia tracheiphila]UIA86216.1 hypothetical protein LU631_14170 [Erwinia tracheiphila]UIA90279.1 hypothetical protein LU632_12685 [Erwinia tracheiphila]
MLTWQLRVSWGLTLSAFRLIRQKRWLSEAISMAFSRVKMEYVLQNAEGNTADTVAMGYDIKANSVI